MNHLLLRLLGVTLPLALAFCACASKPATPPGTGEASMIDLTAIDPNVKPCDDFYQYACGAWIAKTQIPADRPSWGRAFETIDERNQAILHELLENYSTGHAAPANPYAQKLGDFYGSCMDESLAEKTAKPHLDEGLRAIAKISSKAAMIKAIAKMHREGVAVFFHFSSESDNKNPEDVIAGVDQGGLGLPDKDYYLSTTDKMARIRKQYREHMVRMGVLQGKKTAQARQDADRVMKIETALAKVSMDKVERRDPEKTYHRLERPGLVKVSPGIDWNLYFTDVGYPAVNRMNVAVPDFFTGLDAIITQTSLTDLKAYLSWHLVSAAVPAMPKAWVAEDFKFVSEALTGQKELPVRWKRCVRQTQRSLSFALARAYVEKAYGPEAKGISQRMISGIERAFGEGLKNLDWMDDATRARAADKLAKVFNKIGYPDKWRNYDGLKVTRDSYINNLLASGEFEEQYQRDKIDKPLDRTEWGMNPAVVNAYYDASLNEMVFPAGILQRPFFNKDAPTAENYGAIGMVMAHELTHGYDDEGRKFDGKGQMQEWWTPTVGKAFEERASCLANQYSSFTILDGLHVNGKLTLGENIADQGGIRLTYRAWRETPEGKHASLAEERNFFLSFAQSWCNKQQEANQRMRIAVDPHSPPRFRVNAPLQNYPEFAHAFGCEAGTGMAPKQSCQIW